MPNPQQSNPPDPVTLAGRRLAIILDDYGRSVGREATLSDVRWAVREYEAARRRQRAKHRPMPVLVQTAMDGRDRTVDLADPEDWA